METREIAGVAIPDSRLARDATALIRDTTGELLFHHSRRVFLFGSLQAQVRGLTPDPELLYVAAMFHDTGLVEPYRTETQRFEIDGAETARAFLLDHDRAREDVSTVWTAIALHTTPEVPYKMAPVIAATTAGVETDVLGLHLENVPKTLRDAVVAAHPRVDFKNRILHAFRDGLVHRPDSTFGTVNDDVLAHFDPSFVRTDFVRIIQESAWAE